MSIKNDILKNALLLEDGEEDDYRMYNKSGTDDLRKGFDTKDWKIIGQSVNRIRDMTATRIIKNAIKQKDWNGIARACKILGC
jgi:hypothetical protein